MPTLGEELLACLVAIAAGRPERRPAVVPASSPPSTRLVDG